MALMALPTVIREVEQDTSPQAGGDFDLNGNDLTDSTGDVHTVPSGANAARLTKTEDADSVQVQIIEGDRATPSDPNEIYITYRLSDSSFNQDEFVRMTIEGVSTFSGFETGAVHWSILSSNVWVDPIFTINGSGARLPAGKSYDWGSNKAKIQESSGSIDLNAETTSGVFRFKSLDQGSNGNLVITTSNGFPLIGHSAYVSSTTYFLQADKSGFRYINASSGKYVYLGFNHSTNLGRLCANSVVCLQVMDDKQLDFGNDNDVQMKFNTGSGHFEVVVPSAKLFDVTQSSGLRAVSLLSGNATSGAAVVANVPDFFALPCVLFDQDDDNEPFAEFQGNSGANTTSSWSTHGSAGTIDGWIQIKDVNGAKRWIPVYTDPSA